MSLSTSVSTTGGGVEQERGGVVLGLYEETGQAAVKQPTPVLLRAALVAEQVQDFGSHLRAVGLLEAVLVRHEVQQHRSQFAALDETLGDVHGVGNAVLLILQTQLVQLAFDVGGRNVLSDGLCAEILREGTP